jgi:hypothetical protein
MNHKKTTGVEVVMFLRRDFKVKAWTFDDPMAYVRGFGIRFGFIGVSVGLSYW